MLKKVVILTETEAIVSECQMLKEVVILTETEAIVSEWAQRRV